MGNYVIARTKPSIVSALGAIPKPNSENIRLIHDCSRPAHSNVNSYVTTQHFSYVTLDKAFSLVTPDAFLAKIDLKSAYRHVPIHPFNYSATGLAWQFSGEHHTTYIYDCKLPFGASKSPEICHRLTQAISRFMTKRGFRTVLAYLDDFLIIGESESECEIVYNELIRLLGELGFKINWDKGVPPTQRLTFLGVEIDTVNRQLSLPDSKLCELRELCISQFQHCPSPPDNHGAFARVVSPGGGTFAILSWPGGWAFAYPGATPVHLTHLFFFESAIDEFSGVCKAMACPSGTRKTCRCF